jgi:cytochrome c-type biogenesis protein
MQNADPSIPIVFFAGLVSFLSPCVLPLVPGYISYMSGVSTIDGEAAQPRKSALVALAFVAGFTLVFVALGATATLLGSFLADNRTLLGRISGSLIIAMGLLFLFADRIPLLARERRFHPRPGAGPVPAVALGAAFAFGWTPCIGPTLTIALAMAAGQGGGVAKGAGLLGIYSLGLGVPFVLAGMGAARLTQVVGALRRHTRAITLVSGVLLIAIGVLMVTDQLFRLSIWMQERMTAANLDFWNEF